MLLVKLDTTYANKTTIYFESGTPFSFIGIMQVDIQVGIANFYVINTLILFFFV